MLIYIYNLNLFDFFKVFTGNKSFKQIQTLVILTFFIKKKKI